jgi:DNA-binding NarL/FixJ family response regulator
MMQVCHLYVSPGHNFFGHHGQPAAEHPIAALEAMRYRQICIPVVVVTADDEMDTPERVCKLGASSYLRKPIDRDCLLAAMGKAMVGTMEH